VLIMIVDVEDATSGLEPRVSAMVGDGCFSLSDLRNFFKTRFISLNSGLWYLIHTQRARWGQKEGRYRLYKQVVTCDHLRSVKAINIIAPLPPQLSELIVRGVSKGQRCTAG